MEKKASPLALSMWFPNTPSLSNKPSRHLCSQHSPKTNHCTHAINQLSQLKQGKRLLSRSWPYRGQNDSQANYYSPQNVSVNTNYNMGKTIVHPGHAATRKTYTDHTGEEIQSPYLCVRKLAPDPKIQREKHMHEPQIGMENLHTTLEHKNGSP